MREGEVLEIQLESLRLGPEVSDVVHEPLDLLERLDGLRTVVSAAGSTRDREREVEG